ncbi:thioesterase II family protein [Actinoplanes derwentensis]|uniref:Surfactin synthase thioesterase subunit n=1 Tax=Actinoplanes derwentensis TaxID=113562 RepID=A0A1H1Y872_9ACTN|nr:alpha/beta fold hydrolase [Actinoplanes derwentensis]GID86686.1 thioesterase [Actinoplanes derwentensis]SDT17565.1 Surfactin synthase thioesterase subunit [Actinoplanes derwentensis]
MTNPADNLWIRRFHHEPNSRATLVCFPHAGGSASFFYPVSDAMQSTAQVVALQYPGRQDRHLEKPLTSIAALADASFAALRPLMDQPLAFFGHSMGATLAFEVAERMRTALGTAPVTLFASGRRAPSRHRDETVHRSDDDGIVAELKTLSGTDARVLGDPELLRMILPAIRSDYHAAETYRWSPSPPLTCPIVALTGDSDPKVSRDEAQAWGEHTTGGFELRTFPGGHFFLAQHQRAVINLISDQLLTVVS